MLLRTQGFADVELVPEGEASQGWVDFLVRNGQGKDVCLIERAVLVDWLADDELEEFREDMQIAQPVRGAAWVSDYLTHVRAIYAVEFLEAGFDADAGENSASSRTSCLARRIRRDCSKRWRRVLQRNGRYGCCAV